MSRLKLIILFILCFIGINNVANSQDTLNLRDQNYLKRMELALKLSDEQKIKIENYFLVCSNECNRIENKIDSLERNENDENVLIKKMSTLKKEKSEFLEMREFQILTNLNQDQISIYNSEIKPKKPSVLHFGIHNRADCIICK